MTAKETIEEKLEKLAQAIVPDDKLVENVMSRIDSESIVVTSVDTAQNIWRTMTKSPLSKVAAAAAIAIAVGFGVYYFTGSGTTSVYGITDVPELFRAARTVHLKGWLYRPGRKMADGNDVPAVNWEKWFDLENGRKWSTTSSSSGRRDATTITIGELITDGQYRLRLNHTNRWAHFSKRSKYQQMLAEHQGRDQIPQLLFGDISKLNNFVKTGQEEIDGLDYDIWEGEVVHSVTKDTTRYKHWLSPSTGESNQVQAWAKLSDGQYRLDYEYDRIERNVDVPDGIFTMEVPQGYVLKNTKETAMLLELDDGGSVHCGSFTLDPRISFTLSNGSVILGWCSVNRESETSQVELFEYLEFGGALPKLPVEIWGLKPGGWTGDITYVGRHLACTQKGDKFIEWSLYVPEMLPPARSEMLGYDVLYRFNLEERPKWRIAYTLDYGIRVETEEDFNKWVLGAMAELSDDGKAPENVTYESVLQLSEWSQRVID